MPKIARQVPTGTTTPKKTGIWSRAVSPVFETDDPIKLLVYGKSKTGKTRFSSTFPGKTLYLLTSGVNMKGELRSLSKEKLSTFSVIVLERTSDLREIIEDLKRDNPFTTVVVNHISGFQDQNLAEILGLEAIPEQKSWGLAKQDQYGECARQCKTYLRELLNLDCNIVIEGQEKASREEATENDLMTPTVGVDLMPSLAGWLYPAVDYIVRTYKGVKYETKVGKIGNKEVTQRVRTDAADYRMLTGPHEVYQSGFRVPEGALLPQSISDPSYEKVKLIIDGLWEEEE